MRSVVAGLAVAAIAAAPAAAHGIPPATNSVHFAAGDPDALYVTSTFGLLVSHDRGCTFYWVCEGKLGYGDPYEPTVAVAADGTIYATTYTGLRVSRDGGCSFETATADAPADDPGRIAGRFVETVALGPTGDVWVGTGDGAQINDVFVSTDAGATFAPSGLASPLWWTSIAVAPSDAARAYAVGRDATSAHLMRRDGAVWTESPLANVQLGAPPVLAIAAVDPANRDVVYVISTLATGDRLYRSTDGGDSFAEVLAPSAGSIHDVVVRGAEVYATTLVPVGSTLIGGPAYVSTDGGATFAPLPGAPLLACLGAAPDGTLVGCGTNWEPDFKSVARSTDGHAWTKVWRFVELAGALACPAATDDVCEQPWSAVQQAFATTGPACGPGAPDAGLIDEPPPPAAGGCCDAGGGLPSAAWAVPIAAWLGRRRRRATSSAAAAACRSRRWARS